MSKLNIDNQKISELSKMCSELRSVQNEIDELEKQVEIKDKDISQLRTSLISLNHSVKLANAA
jgi:predicted RNase H-like nuclease (RuvC/YqgF family)